jgi:transposase
VKDHSLVRTFVGIDAHSLECSVACISVEGRFVREERVATKAAELRDSLRGLKEPVWLSVEASGVSSYVAYSLEAVVDRVIVNETRENRWIAMNEAKSDPEDARRLARQLRMNEYKEVYLPRRCRQDIRALAQLFKKCSGDLTRQKNRLKARYRGNGIDASGAGIYSSGNRDLYLSRCRRNHLRFMAEVHFEAMDAAAERKKKVLRKLCSVLRNRREYRLLKGIPGVGEKIAAAMIAIIDDPSRFETDRKLWKYSGLGIATPWTGKSDSAHARPCKSGNRYLKDAAMTAAKAAIARDNGFAAAYERMLARGTRRSMAMKTIARKILSTALAIWKSGIPYRARL